MRKKLIIAILILITASPLATTSIVSSSSNSQVTDQNIYNRTSTETTAARTLNTDASTGPADISLRYIKLTTSDSMMLPIIAAFIVFLSAITGVVLYQQQIKYW